MIGPRGILIACLVLSAHIADADDEIESRQDMFEQFAGLPEFARANAVIWCQPMPACDYWRKPSRKVEDDESRVQPGNPDDQQDAGEYLGSVFIVVVTNTQEPLNPEDEASLYAMTDSLKEQNVELTGLAFLPPSAETDSLRQWLYDKCIDCE